MVVKLIEKPERLNNCIQTLPLILMIKQLPIDSINSITKRREFSWHLILYGMLKVVLLNPKMLAKVMHTIWGKDNLNLMSYLKLIIPNTNLLARRELILIISVTNLMVHHKDHQTRNLIRIFNRLLTTGSTMMIERGNSKLEMVRTIMREIKDIKSLHQTLINMVSQEVALPMYRMTTLLKKLPIFHGLKSHLLPKNTNFCHQLWLTMMLSESMKGRRIALFKVMS